MDSINNEMEEIANTVREYFPDSPHMAFNVFRKTYPDIVAGTVVSLVWSFLEYEATRKNPLHNTRDMRPEDCDFFRQPHILN